MNTVTDELLDARLETIETRMDGRVASIERSVAEAIAAANETRHDIKNLRLTIIGTAIATVLGIAAFNATVLSNMVAAFESGKNTAAAQAEVKKQSEETAALIRKMQEDLRAGRTDVDDKK
jgi:high-affinity nickel permease